MLFRYSRWDGTQQLADLDADDLLAAMSDDLMSDGDLWNALRRMFQRGVQNPQGPPVPGIQDMLDRLRKRRQQQLDRYDLGSALEDIKKKLDEVIRTERAGVDRQVKDQGERAKKLETLGQLPPDPAGRIKQLQDYNFTDPEAERLFQELMKSLQQQMLQPFMQGMKQSLEGMSPEDQAHARDDAGPQPHAPPARRGRRARLRRVQGEVGPELPRGREPRRAARAARTAGRSDAVAPRQHVARAAPPAPGDDVEPVHEGRAAGGRDGPARHAPRPARAHRGHATALRLPRRRRAVDARGHEADGRAPADGRARAPAAPRPVAGRSGEDRPRRRREAPRRGSRARPRAAEGAREEAGGGGIPRAQGRPARADRARDPQARRQGAPRHLRAPQA